MFWRTNQEESGWCLHGYESTWMPASLLELAHQPQLVDALFAASRRRTTALHFNKGLAGARIDEIAAATRTSKRMIYYYFESKEGLYIAVLEEAYRRMRAIESELHLDDLAPVRNQLRFKLPDVLPCTSQRFGRGAGIGQQAVAAPGAAACLWLRARVQAVHRRVARRCGGHLRDVQPLPPDGGGGPGGPEHERGGVAAARGCGRRVSRA